jgi:hypothetical protein
LAGLFLHAELYRFLTDDSYIAFRYSRNLADGHGLVFNPGFERVEGYANFLWIVLVGIGYRLGVSCEVGSTVLSLAATAGLWWALVRFTWREFPADARRWVLLPAVLFALTRSVAVWSTSGMETRLFELLVFTGAVRALTESGRVRAGGPTPRPWAALLFGLAALTRPEGIAISVAAALPLCVLHARRGWSALRPWLARSAAVWIALVGAHTAFRLAYYGAWLPNVYYTKVDGRTWWTMGWSYLACFALEYGMWLWVPLVAAGAAWLVRRGRATVPLVFGSMCGMHVLCVVSVGGDHFEYRPLDVVFPFAYVLVALGAMRLSRSRVRAARYVVAAYVVLVAVLVLELPLRSRQEFVPDVPGFPGRSRPVVRETYLDPARSPIYRAPGLRALAEAHRRLLAFTTRHFVGLRREEHHLFLEATYAEGERIANLIERGLLPPDTYLALDCVGAVSYLSDLRVFDRLGLTDAQIARSEFVIPGLMAHGKYTTPEEAARRGVDLWTIDIVRLLWEADDELFLQYLRQVRNEKVGFACVGPRYYLMAWFPQGLPAARERFPALDLKSTLDAEAIAEVERGL